MVVKTALSPLPSPRQVLAFRIGSQTSRRLLSRPRAKILKESSPMNVRNASSTFSASLIGKMKRPLFRKKTGTPSLRSSRRSYSLKMSSRWWHPRLMYSLTFSRTEVTWLRSQKSLRATPCSRLTSVDFLKLDSTKRILISSLLRLVSNSVSKKPKSKT